MSGEKSDVLVNVHDGEEVDCGGRKKKTRVFKIPENDNNIRNLSNKHFAPQSKRKMRWAVNLYSDWRRNRMTLPGVDCSIIDANLEVLDGFSEFDLAYSLCRFVREVRKLDGSEYPPNTVREIIVMLQMFLHENSINWKLLDGENFVGLRNVVDNTMKERHALGLGVRQSSEIISISHEERLFRSGVLGVDSPSQLLQTLIYVIGLHCALRGGAEQNNLRRPGCEPQIKIEKDDRGIECLIYTEDPLQKTNQGGLVCKSKPKKVSVYKASDYRRCPIEIFRKYTRLLPQTMKCKKLYLRPKKKFTPSVWFCDQPYGVNSIKNTVKNVCAKAGIVGRFTNHSLRATCASRMYSKEVPEQIIKEVTGHRSECVRTYKRTSEVLKEKASHTVSSLDEPSTSSGIKYAKIEKNEREIVGVGAEEHKEQAILTMDKMIQNVNETKAEMHKRKVSKARSRLSLKGCRRTSKVTIDLNVNIQK